MRSFVRILPHYTYGDWLHWKGRWELIDGIPWAMHPLPGHNHQKISSGLSIAFGVPLMACNKCAAYQPIDYRVADDIILQPDFLVVCGEITKQYLDFPPALVDFLSVASKSAFSTRKFFLSLES